MNSPRVELDEESSFFDHEDLVATPVDSEDPVGDTINHSMEIESNEKLRKENLHLWTLRFNDPDMEEKVGRGRGKGMGLSIFEGTGRKPRKRQRFDWSRSRCM